MITPRRFVASLALFIFLSFTAAHAQTPVVSTVNVTPEKGRVRVSPVGEVSDLKIEVVSESGETVFESVQGAREQLDWNMTDSAGRRVAPGTYTVTASYTTPDGKPRKRIEQVLVTDERTVGGNSTATTAAATSNAPYPQPLVDGGGAANQIPKFTDADTLTSSAIMDVSGRVGIGTTAAPAAGLRLEVNGITKLTPGGSGGFMQLGTPNTETGLTWSKAATSSTLASRADIRFNGSKLTLAALYGPGVPPASSGITITTAGNVGIGATDPAFKLYVVSPYSTAVAARSTLLPGVSGYSSRSIGVEGISQAGHGVYGSSGSPNAAGVYGYNLSGGWAGYFLGPVTITGGCDGCTAPSSDRSAKTNFAEVDARSMLERVARLPIQRWSYKGDAQGTLHVGPMAQDFRAAFNLGRDDRHIDLIDANGVTMASIQALYQMMLEKDREMARLRARVAQLEQSAKKRRQPRARR